jgi:phosphate transport system permease protein
MSSRTARETQALVEKGLRRRYWAERRFRAYGLTAVLLGVLFVVFLFGSIVSQGSSAFRQAQLTLDIHYDPMVIDPEGSQSPEVLASANYIALVRAALREQFPDVEGRTRTRAMNELVSNSAARELQRRVEQDTSLIGKHQRVSFLAAANVDQLLKGRIDRSLPESSRVLTDEQIGWIDALVARDQLRLRFNKTFFSSGDSREPEQAGVWGAVVGSIYTLLVTLLLSFPIGVAAAIYLEEFAKRNRWTDLIEVNINNLAAVPSIVFGLLGLAVFLNFFGMPRSAPLVGGFVLTLLTLPTIIIAARAALKGVPPSIREGALGMGASKLQVVAHQCCPWRCRAF